MTCDRTEVTDREGRAALSQHGLGWDSERSWSSWPCTKAWRPWRSRITIPSQPMTLRGEQQPVIGWRWFRR